MFRIFTATVILKIVVKISTLRIKEVENQSSWSFNDRIGFLLRNLHLPELMVGVYLNGSEK